MPADMNLVAYYIEMAQWAQDNGLASVVQHTTGKVGIVHNGLEMGQLEKVYFGVLASANMLTAESKLMATGGEIELDNGVVEGIRKAQTIVTPKPEPKAVVTPAAVQPATARPTHPGAPVARRPVAPPQSSGAAAPRASTPYKAPGA